MARVLILSASVGAGHVRAAQAVEKAIRADGAGHDVRHVDVLSIASPLMRRAYGRAYLAVVNRVPHAFGWLYDVLDMPVSARRVRDRLRSAIDRASLRSLERLVEQTAPDIVACTHFLPAEIVAGMKARRDCDARLAIVTTDLDVHRMWVHEPCDAYFVANEEGAVGLRAWGVHADRIHVTGIPIDQPFWSRRGRHAAREDHGLPQDARVVLQLAGGFGIGSIARVHAALLSAATPLWVVAVAGRNDRARREMERVALPSRHGRVVMGFTDRIDELMAAADLVVSKPGGLTTSECLARGVPMLVVEPIPGQETRNADWLLEHGAAIKANSLPLLASKLDELLRDAPRLADMSRRALALGRPRAARDIAAVLLR